MTQNQHICVGELTAPHGVRGLLRLRVLLDDAKLIFKLPLTTDKGASVRLAQKGAQKDGYLVAVDGVADRTAADAFRNTKLFAPRASLPQASETEFYVADLQGVAAFDMAGAPLGSIVAVYDFGAGVSLEIKQAGKAALIVPFNNRCVPQVDMAAKRITVDVPVEVAGEAGR